MGDWAVRHKKCLDRDLARSRKSDGVWSSSARTKTWSLLLTWNEQQTLSGGELRARAIGIVSWRNATSSNVRRSNSSGGGWFDPGCATFGV